MVATAVHKAILNRIGWMETEPLVSSSSRCGSFLGSALRFGTSLSSMAVNHIVHENFSQVFASGLTLITTALLSSLSSESSFVRSNLFGILDRSEESARYLALDSGITNRSSHDIHCKTQCYFGRTTSTCVCGYPSTTGHRSLFILTTVQ